MKQASQYSIVSKSKEHLDSKSEGKNDALVIEPYSCNCQAKLDEYARRYSKSWVGCSKRYQLITTMDVERRKQSLGYGRIRNRDSSKLIDTSKCKIKFWQPRSTVVFVRPSELKLRSWGVRLKWIKYSKQSLDASSFPTDEKYDTLTLTIKHCSVSWITTIKRSCLADDEIATDKQLINCSVIVSLIKLNRYTPARGFLNDTQLIKSHK